MPTERIILTEREIAKLPLATQGQYVVRDKELKGFFLVVGKRKKTFTIHGESWKDGKRTPVHMAIGAVGDINAKDARLMARDYLTRFARGLPPVEPEPRSGSEGEKRDDKPPAGITLVQAWERYRDGHMVRKNRGARTIESYRDHVERIFASWGDQPLKELGDDPSLVATRHDKITKENGPYIANGAMRTLRAIYNHARKTHRFLPADNPVDAIDWNQEKRRDTGMGAKALPGWFDELVELENPLRREFHLFSLLSGCRPGALKVAEVAHLDLRRRILHIPAPKGGAKKAFDIPLSRPMMRCLIRAIRIGRVMHPRAAERWIFAADSAPGHLIEQKEERTVLSKWANDLRQTFRTIGQAAEVPPLDIHILMNHSLPGVNAGYITVSGLMDGHLRRQQERISRAVLDAVKAGNGKHRVRTLAWLCSSKIEAASERQADPVSPKRAA
jgi:integrase